MHFQYAVDVLSTCSLSACRISSPILSVLGKWLITHVGTFIPPRSYLQLLPKIVIALRLLVVASLSALNQSKHILQSPDNAPNKMARRILASLHWGPRSDSETELWMDSSVHLVCAETIVKVSE